VDPLLSAGVVLLNHGAAQPRSCSTTVLLNHGAAQPPGQRPAGGHGRARRRRR